MIAIAPASFGIVAYKVNYIYLVWVAVALSVVKAMREPDNRIKRYSSHTFLFNNFSVGNRKYQRIEMNRVFSACVCIISFMLLLSSCKEDEIDLFYGYNVADREGFDPQSLSLNYCGDTVFITGLKNERMWVGMFDGQTKEQLREWSGTEPVERTMEIDLGYGNFLTVKVSGFGFSNYYKTDWGGVSYLRYMERDTNWSIGDDEMNTKFYYKDVLFLNDNNAIVYPTSYDSGHICNTLWFQGSIIIDSQYNYIVLSPNGKEMAVLEECVYSGVFPVSYTDGVFLNYGGSDKVYYSICRHNYQTAKDVWSTSIPSLQGIKENTRINTTVLEQKSQIWKVQIDATSIDGSKQQIVLTIDVETGELTEIDK